MRRATLPGSEVTGGTARPSRSFELMTAATAAPRPGEEPEERQTPPTCDLLSLLLRNRRPTGAVNEVWPNLFVGDAATAQQKPLLADLGITHVLNAADGPQHIDTGPQFYSDVGLKYHGVPAADRRDFDLAPYFGPAADFIHEALSQRAGVLWLLSAGKVLVHCARGISRSAALALAYLMIRERLSLVAALELVCQRRNILPNAGFLEQLRRLDTSLQRGGCGSGEKKMASHGSHLGRGINVGAAADEYVTPGGYELEKILNRGSVAYTHVNEVWPGVYIGDEQTAKDKSLLKTLGVTHVLNAAEGTWNNVDTGAPYYADMDVVYYGMVAEDVTTFDLSPHFYPAAHFIRETLSVPENKLLVHCVMGRSRSATLFLAYLMICEDMTLVDAVEHVKRRRRIIPNWGFLKQLRELDMRLLEERK
ncbi:uncharacterized protein LOC142881844 [Nelusetta ayraudi]|uniref:uncharacterized protein LOC142881844 n=1 Tax=Nelusetta ayraudi TaxID=303726 RepID=UPI003F72E639